MIEVLEAIGDPTWEKMADTAERADDPRKELGTIGSDRRLDQ